MKSKQYLLTADRTLMSHYRGNMLYGFLSSLPAEKVNPHIYKEIFCPSVKFNRKTGEAQCAPLGIRRIEGGLLNEFRREDVLLTHPDHLHKSLGQDTKIVGIEVMDAFGFSPVPLVFNHGLVNSINIITFKKLCQKIKDLKKKNDFKVVVGGAGAWQLCFDKKVREEYGIDHVVIGEADDKISGIYNDISTDSAPDLIYTHTDEIDNIPYIQGPTCNGLIEAMRGCGRGCDFCDPNLRKKRDFGIERLKKEAMVNLKYGINTIWLQSEEILLYGLDNSKMEPNKDAIVNLYKELKSLPNVDYVTMMHLTFSSAMAVPDCISKIAEINHFNSNKWGGVQTGLETGSSKIIKKHMPLKVKPFSAEEWPWLVREGIKLLNKNHYFTVSTLIIGLPGEQDDDVRETIELIKSLDGTNNILVPLFYTDFQNTKNSINAKDLSRLQWELNFCCWQINAKVMSKWIWNGTAHFNPYFRIIANIFMKLGVSFWLRTIRDTAKRETGIELM